MARTTGVCGSSTTSDAERADRARAFGMLAGGLAHDLKHPLSIGFVLGCPRERARYLTAIGTPGEPVAPSMGTGA
jgi:hypothetical protein